MSDLFVCTLRLEAIVSASDGGHNNGEIMIIKNAMKTTIASLVFVFVSTSAMADWPVAVVDKVAFHPAQKSIRVNVLSNDIGEGLKVTEFNQWSENGARLLRGFQVGAGANIINYVAPSDYDHVGEDGFWYVIEDEQGRTNTARVSVDVKPANSALPAPQEDIVETPQDVSIRIDVLKNDLFTTDTGNGLTTIRGVITEFNEWSQQGGQVEKIAVYPDNSFGVYSPADLTPQKFHLRYTPKPGFVGVDHFWYVVKDSNASQLGTQPQFTKVTIHVLKDETIEAPYPVANPDQEVVSCLRSCGVSGLNVLENDTGRDLIIKLDSAWSLKGAKVQVIPNHPNPPFIGYIPASESSSISGPDKVWYVIEDAYGRQNWGVLEVEVN
jgi:hypothetical protein